MAFLSGVQAASAAGLTVRPAVLAHFDFLGQPGWYWMGFGPLVTADGQVWDGTGAMARIDGLNVPIGTTAEAATFTLSGVDVRVAALARQQSALVKGRDVRVLVQFYTDEWGLADDPVEVWSGILDVMTYRALGEGRFAVSVTAENVWSGRNKSPFGFLNDTDQQARFPGDRGLELVGSLPNKAINWPT